MNDAIEPAVTPEEILAAETAPEQPVPEVQSELPVMPAPETPQKIKKIKKSRRRPWPLKILLELVAIVLCVALFAVTIAGALIVDLRVMTSQGGFEKILTQLIAPTGSVQAVPQPGVTLLSAPDQSQDAANFVTDMIYDMLQENFGQEVPVTKDQISEFIDKSTVTEFIAEKMSGAVNDFLNETSDTTITKDEIMDLVRDNSALLKESFDVEITDDMMTQLETALDEVPIWDELEEKGLVGYLEENLLLPDSEADGSSNGLAAIKQAMDYVRMVTSNMAIACFAGAMLLLALLVLLVNWSVPKTLSDVGITLLFAGLILSSLNFIGASGVLETLLADQLQIIGLINGILASVAVVHYGVLGTGVALIVLAIIAKIIKNSRRKMAMLEAL
ncbi:MAG: hypothetical protein IJO04_01000 [Oscillospiraceae bacterium]|nr:hypothetical protein [Oscillospiraceae bacterium]